MRLLHLIKSLLGSLGLFGLLKHGKCSLVRAILLTEKQAFLNKCLIGGESAGFINCTGRLNVFFLFNIFIYYMLIFIDILSYQRQFGDLFL